MTLRENLNEIINELSVGYSEELLESAENLHGDALYWTPCKINQIILLKIGKG
jgi:hypothetical protein